MYQADPGIPSPDHVAKCANKMRKIKKITRKFARNLRQSALYVMVNAQKV